MSIASEIARLSSAKAALKDAIVAKGVEVADSLKLDGYAEKIAEIDTDDWVKPAQWPDVREILKNDTGIEGHPEYTNKYIGLLVPLAGDGEGYRVRGALAYKFFNGIEWEEFITNGDYLIHDFYPADKTKFCYLIAYSSKKITSVANRTTSTAIKVNTYLWVVGYNKCEFLFKSGSFGGNFCYSNALVRIENADFEIIAASRYYGNFYSETLSSLKNVTVSVKGAGMASLFERASGLTKIPVISTDPGSITDCRYAFSGCQSLGGSLEDVDVGSPTYFQGFIENSRRITALPKYLDLSNVVDTPIISFSISPIIGSCLEKIPLVIVPNKESSNGIDFKWYSANVNPDTIAKFSKDGEIVDGFAAFKPIPDGWYAAGKTSDATGAVVAPKMTLSNEVRTLFTADQISAIESAFSNHNWTLAWASSY